MRTLVFAVVFFAATTASAAEYEKPAPPPNGLHVGGYGGPTLFASSLAGEPAVLGGVRGGLLLERRLTLGGAGFGLLNPVEAPSPARGQDPRIGFGAGGVWAQWVWAPTWTLQPTTGLVIGAGSLSHQRHSFSSDYTSSAFFFVMPEIGLEMPITETARIGVEASYRFVRGVDLPGFANSDASTPAIGIHAKFGVF